jgi:LysM repeat protein
MLSACSSKKEATTVEPAEPVAMESMPPPDTLDMGPGFDTDFDDSAANIPALPPETSYGSVAPPSYSPITPPTQTYPDYGTSTSGSGSYGGSGDGGSYTVQRGDTLWGISRRHGVSVNALAAANGISPNNILRIGQRLTIPGGAGSGATIGTGSTASSGRTYRVQRGDTYSTIARRFGVTTQQLMSANHATSSLLREGQVLQIP